MDVASAEAADEIEARERLDLRVQPRRAEPVLAQEPGDLPARVSLRRAAREGRRWGGSATRGRRAEGRCSGRDSTIPHQIESNAGAARGRGEARASSAVRFVSVVISARSPCTAPPQNKRDAPAAPAAETRRARGALARGAGRAENTPFRCGRGARGGGRPSGPATAGPASETHRQAACAGAAGRGGAGTREGRMSMSGSRMPVGRMTRRTGAGEAASSHEPGVADTKTHLPRGGTRRVRLVRGEGRGVST